MEDPSILHIVQQQTVLLRSMQEEIARLSQKALPQNVNVPWPTPINVDIDPQDAFKSFLSAWTNYCSATQMDEWSAEQEPRKISVLFSAIGGEALKKYGNFGLTDTDKTNKTCKEILQIISTKMLPKKNIIYNRYIFLSRMQQKYEVFDVFYADLAKLIEDCDYATFKDEMLRDKIVLGIKDMKTKKELLKKDNLTLSDAVNLCRAAEATERHMKDLSGTATSEIKKIEDKDTSKKRKCKFCANYHVFKKEICPAWGKECENCKGKNHLEKACKKKRQVKVVMENKTEEQSSSLDSDTEYVINKIINKKNNNLAECTLEYLAKNKWKTTKCLLDTAADECLIGFQNVRDMFGESYLQEKMRTSKKTLFGFGGNHIIVHGEIDLILRTNISGLKKKHTVTFQIVHNTHIPLLSCQACTNMGLVKFCKEVQCNYSQEAQAIINKYSSVFEGRGSFSGEVNLEIDETVSPVIQKARRVPVALRSMLKEELKRLEEEGIITKEDNHTDWIVMPAKELWGWHCFNRTGQLHMHRDVLLQLKRNTPKLRKNFWQFFSPAKGLIS